MSIPCFKLEIAAEFTPLRRLERLYIASEASSAHEADDPSHDDAKKFAEQAKVFAAAVPSLRLIVDATGANSPAWLARISQSDSAGPVVAVSLARRMPGLQIGHELEAFPMTLFGN